MFERFTEAARRALFFARYEVTQLGATDIEPHHILLGLIRESKGLVPRILGRRNVSMKTLRQQIEARTEFREAIPTSQEVPFSRATKRVLQYAAEEADRLKHSYIGTEHLLLGVLCEEGSMAAELLGAAGLRLDDARDTIIELMQVQPLEGQPPTTDHVGEIRRLVDALAQFAPDTPDARELVAEIKNHLRVLERGFRE
jgi:ATP-dependent Clp protease ATP-binding subunit ClpC